MVPPKWYLRYFERNSIIFTVHVTSGRVTSAHSSDAINDVRAAASPIAQYSNVMVLVLRYSLRASSPADQSGAVVTLMMSTGKSGEVQQRRIQGNARMGHLRRKWADDYSCMPHDCYWEAIRGVGNHGNRLLDHPQINRCSAKPCGCDT